MLSTMILERSAFFTVNLGFTLSFIALLTPGWLTLKMSYQEMFRSGILDQRAFNDLIPNGLTMTSMWIATGPFYSRYCMGYSYYGLSEEACSSVTSVAMIKSLKSYSRTIAEVISSVNEKTGEQVTLEKVISWYTTVVVVCVVILVQCFLSLSLAVLNFFKKQPSKHIRLGGGVSSILSGTLNTLMAAWYLWEHRDLEERLEVSEFKNMIEASFPYSPMLSLSAVVTFFIGGGILIYLTKHSGQRYPSNHDIELDNGATTKSLI